MVFIQGRWLKKGRTKAVRHGQGMRYRVIYEEEDGRRQYESCSTRDQTETIRAKRSVEAHEGTVLSKEKHATTFGGLWPRFEAIKAGAAKKIHEMYMGSWTLFVRYKWSSTPVREMKPSAVAEWLAGLKSERTGKRVSESYEHTILLTVKGICTLAVEDGMMPVNQLKSLKARSQPSSSRRYLEVHQADALIAEITPNNLVVEVMLHTLVRRGEAAGLKMGDLSVGRKWLRIEWDIDDDGNEDATKNKRHRDVPVSGKLLEDLKATTKGRSAGEFIMTGLGGKPWTKHTWRTVCENARDASGVTELDTQELRHTGVIWAIHAGANIKTIQRMCGHALASMTLDIYGHLWDDQLDEVAAKVYDYMSIERAEHAKGEAKNSMEGAGLKN